MDPQVQGSFIPKQSLAPQTRGVRFGLFFIIALLFFLGSLAAAGGAFAYEQYLKNGIATKSEDLIKAEGAFDPASIETLVRLDARMQQTNTLLQSHVAPSAIFDLLAVSTLEKVQFTSFEFAMSQDGTGDLAVNGIADSFSTVALQSDQFSAVKVLKDVIFSGITVGSAGKITFQVNATIDPSLLLYSRSLKSTTQQQEVPQQIP